MTAEYFHYKVGVLEKHCENVGRDPAEIKKTLLMPTLLSEDKEAVEAMMTGRRLGEGSALGSKSYIIDRVGELIDAGAEEIMFGGIDTAEPDEFVKFEEEIIAAFS